MKKGAMIIDISCDRAGGIETSIPTTIENPIYFVDGIVHYVVDHTPSLFYKTISESLSKSFVKFTDLLIEGKENDELSIRKGEILDERIFKYKGRNNIFCVY